LIFPQGGKKLEKPDIKKLVEENGLKNIPNFVGFSENLINGKIRIYVSKKPQIQIPQTVGDYPIEIYEIGELVALGEK